MAPCPSESLHMLPVAFGDRQRCVQVSVSALAISVAWAQSLHDLESLGHLCRPGLVDSHREHTVLALSTMDRGWALGFVGPWQGSRGVGQKGKGSKCVTPRSLPLDGGVLQEKGEHQEHVHFLSL